MPRNGGKRRYAYLGSLVGDEGNPSEESPTETEDGSHHDGSLFGVPLGETVDPTKEERVRRSHQTKKEVSSPDEVVRNGPDSKNGDGEEVDSLDNGEHAEERKGERRSQSKSRRERDEDG